MKSLFPDYLFLCKIEIDEGFLTAKLKVVGCWIRARRDKNEHIENLLKFVRRRLAYKRMSEYEPKCSECICFGLFCQWNMDMFLQLHVAWVTQSLNFFERSSVSLSKPILKYESALNIDDFDEYIKEF